MKTLESQIISTLKPDAQKASRHFLSPNSVLLTLQGLRHRFGDFFIVANINDLGGLKMNEEMLYQAELDRLGEIIESEVACEIESYAEVVQ